MSKNYPTFVLSGMSGTGKSCIIEDARSMGFKVLRSFNKILLDTSMGDGVPLHTNLIADAYMQAYHIYDYARSEINEYPLMIERSLLDHYFYLIKVSGYEQSIKEYQDMIDKLSIYFKFITNYFSKKLILIEINNYDTKWINQSLSENEHRKSIFNNDKVYLEYQKEYRMWIISMMNILNIPYDSINLDIHKVDKEFTAEIRRSFINKLIK
jgi:hypothetical protein